MAPGEAVENLVKPIRDALKETGRQIGELEKARSEAYGSIRSQIEAMQISQKSLAEETQNLVKALRRPEVRGRWGEITLRRLVELAGMVEHCDFQEQVHNAADDKVIRPDMIVRMPDRRELIVDVKTPLDAYLEAVEATTDARRKLGLDRQARNAASSTYANWLSAGLSGTGSSRSPEFVILFIPGDQFLSAALNEDPELIEFRAAHQTERVLADQRPFGCICWKAVAPIARRSSVATGGECRGNPPPGRGPARPPQHLCWPHEQDGQAAGGQVSTDYRIGPVRIAGTRCHCRVPEDTAPARGVRPEAESWRSAGTTGIHAPRHNQQQR
ncbi:MAG: DNA recombination protein RmuC [Woeseiaceae bacterium]|nr:DNA recombination protein RmuC [Woeseiaceae bacterium]